MPRHMRRNVILSHGGQHGPSSRTLRKGAVPTQRDVEQIPDHVLGVVTEQGVDAPAKPTAEVEARMRRRDEELAAKEKGAKVPAKVEKKAPPPSPPPAEPKAEEPEPEPEELEAEEPKAIEMPTSKRKLFLLKKVEAVALLDQLGIEHEDNISSTDAKALLADKLGL